MSNTIKYEAVATIGEYKDRAGETKKRYVNIGKVFENDKGQLSLKLDTIPVDQNWSGWVSFYEPKERQEQGRDRTPADAYRKMHGSEKQVVLPPSPPRGGYTPDPDDATDDMPPSPPRGGYTPDPDDATDDIPF